MVAAALLGLSGTASAAGTDNAAPGRDPGARQAKKCDRLDHVITKLERVKTHLEKKIARVEAKIASGDLSPEQLERARVFLARLQNRLEKLDALMDRLEAKFAEKCAQDA